MSRAQLSLGLPDTRPEQAPLAPGAWLLPGFALPAGDVLAAVEGVVARAPLRHLVTPGGFTMSVAMTNCGSLGWHSDRSGYRYTEHDPLSGERWPPMPDPFVALARAAAARAGYRDFAPEACLVNRYVPGARLTLHQDKDEGDLSQPIVSVSLGLPAVFLFGGPKRRDPQQRIPVSHGDVIVWGGPTRLHYHGVLPLKDGQHPDLGAQRINLTFRKAR